MDYLEHFKNKFSISSDTITVLSPYLSENFLSRLNKLFSPSQLIVVTDRNGELKVREIEEKYKENPKLRIHLAKPEGDGILHAKLFFFAGKDKNILLWGSSNATKGAFEENAEVYSWCVVSDDGLVDYFKKLDKLNENEKVEKLEVTLDHVHLILPSVLYVESKDSFDMWLEEGSLFFPETLTLPDSFKIQLKKDFKIKATAKLHRFTYNDSKTLTYLFIEKVKLPQIKRYSIQTVYGYWIPKEVAIWYEKNKYILENKVGNYVKEMKEKESDIINQSFKDIQELSHDLLSEGSSLKEYFEDEALTENELNEEYFKLELQRQLEEHIKKCKKLQRDAFARSFIESIKESKDQGSLSNIIKEKLKKQSKQKELMNSCFIEWGETPETILNNLRESYHFVKQGIGEGLTQKLEELLSKSGKPKKDSDNGEEQLNLHL